MINHYQLHTKVIFVYSRSTPKLLQHKRIKEKGSNRFVSSKNYSDCFSYFKQKKNCSICFKLNNFFFHFFFQTKIKLKKEIRKTSGLKNIKQEKMNRKEINRRRKYFNFNSYLAH